MAIAYVNSYLATTTNKTTPMVSPSFTPATGELLVVKAVGEDSTITFGTPTASGSSVTWTLRISDNTANKTSVRIWTGVVTSGGVATTVSSTITNPNALLNYSMIVERYTGAAGSATTISARGSGAPSTTLTIASTSVVSWASGDWSAQVPTSRTYRANTTETGIHNANPQGAYVGYYARTTGSGSVALGLTAPGSQNWALCAVELTDTGGAQFSGTLTETGSGALALAGSPNINGSLALSGSRTFDASGTGGTTTETITYRAKGATFASATGTTSDIAYPAGIQAGDLLVIALHVNLNRTFTAPAGWTVVSSGTTATNNQTVMIYKVADGTETGTVTITNDSTATARRGVMAAFDGVDPVNPIDGTPTLRSVTSTTAPYTMASQTPTMAGTLPVWAVTVNNTSTVWTPNPAGTEILQGILSKSGAFYYDSAVEPDTSATGVRGGNPDTTGANSGVYLLLRPNVINTGPSNYSGSLNLAGSGNYILAGVPTMPGSLAIAGSRSFTFDGVPTMPGTLALSRTGSTQLAGSPTTPGTLALSGTGATNSYVGIPTLSGTLSLSQSRTINLSGVPLVSASLSVSGTGGVAGQGTPAPVSTVTINGTGTLAMSAAVAIPGVLTLTGAGLLALAGSTAGAGTLNLTGSRTLNFSGVPTWTVTLGLSGSRTLAQAGAPAFSDTVNLFGVRSLTQGGSPSVPGTLGLSGTGNDGYGASPSTAGALPLSQTRTFGASGTPNPAQNLALSGDGDLQFAGARDGSGELLLSGSGVLDFAGTPSIPSTLWLAAFHDFTAGGSPSTGNSLGLAGSTTLDLSGNLAVSGTLGLNGSGGTGQQGNPAIPGTTALSGTGLLNLLATALSMASTMNLTGDRVLVLSGVASAEGQGSLNLSGSRVLGFTGTPSINGTLSRSGTGVLEVEGTQANAGTLLLQGTRTLTLDAAPAVAGTLALTSAGEFTFDGAVLVNGSLLITRSRTLTLSGRVVGEDTGGMFLKDGTELHAFMLVGGILIPVTPNFGE